jgi:hypothetical protein
VLGAAGLTLLAHIASPLFGRHIFNERYLTILIPLGAAATAVAFDRSPIRPLPALFASLLATVGVAVFAQRFDKEYEPDLQPLRAAVASTHPRQVLTNSAVVLYYLRQLRPKLDRPFGLGRAYATRVIAPAARTK